MKRSTRPAALMAAPLAMLTATPLAAFAQTQPNAPPASGAQPSGTQPSGTQPDAVAAVPTQPQSTASDTVSAPPASPNALAQLPPMPHTQIYYHAGVWDAFSGQTPRGVPVCGVGTTNPADGKALSIRFVVGGNDTVFAASKPGWAIPDGTKITVVMQIGLNPPWTMHGTGEHRSIEWAVGRDAIQPFDQQFRDADSMTLSFPDGNEPPWRMSLTGSTAISDTFGRCVTDLTNQYQASREQGGAPAVVTQPFSRSHATNGAPAQ